MEMKTVDSRVRAVLSDCPQTRYDDMLLILEYNDRYSDFPFPVGQQTFENVICNYQRYGLPCFESIRRARQRVQSVCPEVSRNVQETGKPEPVLVIQIFG